MPHYKFKINDLEYRTVDVFDLDDAPERAGIAKDGSYGLLERDKFDKKYLVSTGEALFWS